MNGNANIPVTLQFLNNGALSISVGDETFRPDESDLKAVYEWASKVSDALGIPTDQAVIGAFKGLVVKK